MEFRAAVFDMDGVLIDSEPVHIESWVRLFEREGVNANGIDFQTAIGLTDEAFLLKLRGEGRLEGEVQRLCAAKQEIYSRIYEDRFRPQPGARETVVHFSRRMPVAIATSDWRENAFRAVALLGLDGILSVVLCRDDVERCKPDPEIYLAAAKALKVSPEDCLGVEDSPSGVKAVKAAGMKCAAVTSSVPASWLCEADWIIPGVEQLPEAIG